MSQINLTSPFSYAFTQQYVDHLSRYDFTVLEQAVRHRKDMLEQQTAQDLFDQIGPEETAQLQAPEMDRIARLREIRRRFNCSIALSHMVARLLEGKPAVPG